MIKKKHKQKINFFKNKMQQSHYISCLLMKMWQPKHRNPMSAYHVCFPCSRRMFYWDMDSKSSVKKIPVMKTRSLKLVRRLSKGQIYQLTCILNSTLAGFKNIVSMTTAPSLHWMLYPHGNANFLWECGQPILYAFIWSHNWVITCKKLYNYIGRLHQKEIEQGKENFKEHLKGM